MKNILVATDFSAPATNAVNYAVRVASETRTELTLFNVLKPDVHVRNSLASPTSLEGLKKNSENRLAELAQEIEAHHPIRVRWECKTDSPIESLQEHITTHPMDLVVMGIESNLPEYKLFGNTTTAAIKLMQFPLLVVPNGVAFEGIKRVVYACEPAHLMDGSELAVLGKLVRALGVPIEVVHVFEKDTDARVTQAMESIVGAALTGVSLSYHYVTHQKVGSGLQTFMEQSPTDLLVMVSHRLGLWETIATGSHTRQMTLRTRVPLLVVPGRAR